MTIETSRPRGGARITLTFSREEAARLSEGDLRYMMEITDARDLCSFALHCVRKMTARRPEGTDRG